MPDQGQCSPSSNWASMSRGPSPSPVPNVEMRQIEAVGSCVTPPPDQQRFARASLAHQNQQDAALTYPPSITYMHTPPHQGPYHYSTSQTTATVKKDGGKGKNTPTGTVQDDMRQLARESDGKSLTEAAKEAFENPSEKSKQVFALRWIQESCKRVNGPSVLRQYVHSQYAERCKTERITALKCASFGKLVHVIFPGIRTRRLGVRQQSKYHYSDLVVVNHGDDRSSYDDAHCRRLLSQSAENGTSSGLSADTAVFPPQDQPDEPSSTQTGRPSLALAYARPWEPGYKPDGWNTSFTYEKVLMFPATAYVERPHPEAVELPNIHNFVPAGTDIHTSEALAALYRNHCSLLVYTVRYTKQREFFNLFRSFRGTLTTPVQELYEHPSLAPWISECDWLTYQKMASILSRLVLQLIPDGVHKHLDIIVRNLHRHISKCFQGFPRHVLEARLESATLFTGLLKKLLRVNKIAIKAAKILADDQKRNNMWTDWVGNVNPKCVMESALFGGKTAHAAVYNILTNDVHSLLSPLSTPELLAFRLDYQVAAGLPPVKYGGFEVTGNTVFDRLASFTSALMVQFPKTDAQTLLNGISNVTSAACRDILMGSETTTYEDWTITMSFVVELSQWHAELGGFLAHQPPATSENRGVLDASSQDHVRPPHFNTNFTINTRPMHTGPGGGVGVEGDTTGWTQDALDRDHGQLPDADDADEHHEDSGIYMSSVDESLVDGDDFVVPKSYIGTQDTNGILPDQANVS